VASTGNLEPMPDDRHRDELSEMVAAFNRMTVQLGELRESLRRKDYLHGAADQAAGLLHNVRNALSPIGTIAWDLARAEDDPWKQNLAKAIPQLEDETLDPERARKLRSFVALSAGRMLAEGRLRQADLKSLAGMLRHVDAILKDVDRLSRTEHALEPVPLAASVAEVAPLVEKRPGITLTIDLPFGVEPLGHRLTLDQILANLLLNAAEAIEAGEGRGTISITARELSRGNGSALDITVRDDGQGIAPEALEMIFEKGFSTRRERSSGLGLHWCANAANAMGGRLYAESAGLGRGATLHLVLPLASALEEAA
jgi:signal transduction histidine kinase